MDARVRTGVGAYDQPAGGQSCPPAGGTSTASGVSSGAASGGSPGASAKPTSPTGATTSDFTGAESGYYDIGADGNGDGRSNAEALRDAMAKVGELKEFAAYYVAAKLDSFKVTFRNLGVYAALGIVGLIAGSAIITTAAVLLLVGLAWGLGDLLWDQYWLGAVLVGLLVLGGIAAGIIIGMKKLTNSSRKRTVEKYENRQRDQRSNFGQDVRGRRAGV